MIELKPLDIVTVDGLWYAPHHWMIRQRGQGDKAVHSCVVLNSLGDLENVGFIRGPHLGDTIDRYKGRHISIHRRKEEVPLEEILRWLWLTRMESNGYDLGQLAAAYFGISSEEYRNDSSRWSCSERSYFLFADNDFMPANCNEILPHPRWVRHSDDFRSVFEGIWG